MAHIAETAQAETPADTTSASLAPSDQRLIEAGFPCHQVGAETQRERGASSALPPLYYLHVWWARRPLTPSRAAILASLLPADADPEEFVKALGIRVFTADVRGVPWVLDDSKLRERVREQRGQLQLKVDGVVRRALEKEVAARADQRALLQQMVDGRPSLSEEPTIKIWREKCQPFPDALPAEGTVLQVTEEMGDPSWFKALMELAKESGVRVPNLYGYGRAYANAAPITSNPKVILDPTAGGGSIPFEALRLGHHIVANELNPVASLILKATLDYPARFGVDLVSDIRDWGNELLNRVDSSLAQFFPGADTELDETNPKPVEQITTYLYCRQVTCPHCGGDAPLLNSCWLSKEGEKWGVAVETRADRTVRFRPYRIEKGNRGPNGEDPNERTVTRGIGQCVHCQQAIDGDEVKRQARGESEHGRWQDRLYCVVAIRLEPKLDKHGRVQRYTSGAKAGQIKTRKVRYFREPNEVDLQALQDAEAELTRRRFDFEMKGLIPNEPFPQGNDMRPVTYGMPTWADMFTPRQLLGHLIAAETLNDLKPKIIEGLGEERGRAVITYLQFAIDKGVDYNSKQTRWHFSRGVLIGTFGRHDFSLKWTFGEMVFAGPSSGLAWGLAQVIDAYKGISELVEPARRSGVDAAHIITRLGSATDFAELKDGSVDAVIMDPPYYDNVQYSELSDFYYVWQKRTLADLYPQWFTDVATNKDDEAVANQARDGSARNARVRYEELMEEIFAECRRVLRRDGIMTLMFTHKSQDAWETLTNALIQADWDITAAMPIESESGHSTHQMNMAAAASSIFIACRPANRAAREQASWSFGGGVKAKLESAVREGLKDFERLKLNPVDRMIAAWGRALRVYSAHWPVLDGEEEVTPTRAMQEAARVVAEEEVSRLSGGRVTVDDLDAESRLAVIALGINGLGDFAFDDALQMSKSLNLALQRRNGNYRVDTETVVYANEADDQLAAPLAKKGSRLRLLRPEQRLSQRLAHPQTLWDTLCGLIVNYREGGVVAARNYLTANDQRESDALRGLLQVWANECRDDALRREALLIDYEL
ncbi:MAG: DUF1156 domain-containing protein [Nitrococcus mobilis]|nr:DUF1156 domain-containing protein [Nitrococcus mobilis]